MSKGMGKFSSVIRRGKVEAGPNPRWLKMATYMWEELAVQQKEQWLVWKVEMWVTLAYFFAYASLCSPCVLHKYILVFAQKS